MRHAPFAVRVRGLALAAALGAAMALAVGGPARPAAGGDAGALPDFVSVAARARPGVVHVVNYLSRERDVPDPGDPDSKNDNVGSGFVWTTDGWIVTNSHVTAGARTTLVHVEGRGWFPAALRGTDKVADVALLKIDAQGLVPLPVGDPASLRVGQWVLAGGSPNRLERSFTHGIVAGLSRSDTGANPGGFEDFIQTDAAANVGSSGGPLLDASGRVVGLVTAILSRTGGFQGVSLAVPIDVVLAAAEQLRARGTVVRPTIGVRLRAADPLRAIGLPGGAGLEVTDFAEESSGRRAGLRRGDVILSLDGVATPTRGTLQRLLWSRARGASVTLRLWRGDHAEDVSVRLDEG
jgi:serine protease Do